MSEQSVAELQKQKQELLSECECIDEGEQEEATQKQLQAFSEWVKEHQLDNPTDEDKHFVRMLVETL